MRRPIRFLLFLAALAGLAALAIRVRARLAAPTPLGSPDVGAGPPAPTPEGSASPDDLAEVWGIGPVFRDRLAEAGIATFAALAAADPAGVAAATGVPERRAAGWITQAAAFAAR